MWFWFIYIPFFSRCLPSLFTPFVFFSVIAILREQEEKQQQQQQQRIDRVNFR